MYAGQGHWNSGDVTAGRCYSAILVIITQSRGSAERGGVKLGLRF